MAHNPEDRRSETRRKRGGWRKVLESVTRFLKPRDNDEWLKDMRGNMSLVATVIATITFQIALNPPGGVIQVTNNDSKAKECDPSHRSETQWPCPGEAVLAVRYEDTYHNFLLFNTLAFAASLSVCLLLVSGIPLNHRITMYLFSVGMCMTLTFLTLTYISGALMVTPNPIWSSVTGIFGVVLLVWLGLLLLVFLCLTVRFLIWSVNKCTNKCCASPTAITNGENNDIPALNPA